MPEYNISFAEWLNSDVFIILNYIINKVMRSLQHDDHEVDLHDDHEELDAEASKSLTGIKILIIVLLLLAGLFVFFPYSQVKPKKEGDSAEKKKECCKGRFFSISNCFAAGMLLSMALCHILPEAEGMY